MRITDSATQCCGVRVRAARSQKRSDRGGSGSNKPGQMLNLDHLFYFGPWLRLSNILYSYCTYRWYRYKIYRIVFFLIQTITVSITNILFYKCYNNKYFNSQKKQFCIHWLRLRNTDICDEKRKIRSGFKYGDAPALVAAVDENKYYQAVCRVRIRGPERFNRIRIPGIQIGTVLGFCIF